MHFYSKHATLAKPRFALCVCLYIIVVLKAAETNNNIVEAELSTYSSTSRKVDIVYKKNSEIAFAVFDANDDKKISPLELRTALRAFGYPQSLAETKALLDNFDTNMNYNFERSEFFEMMKTMGLNENEDVNVFWKQHDILSAQAARSKVGD
eukprot:g6621.t1